MGPDATSEPPALRTPPTQPDAPTGHSGSGQGGAVADFIQRRPQAFPDPRASRPRHPQGGRLSQSNGCGQEPPPTPARIGPPAAFPGLAPIPQAKPGWCEPRSGCGAPTPPAAPQGGGREQGLGEGSARGPPPSALTMATPLNLQQSAPTARGASRGQVTLRPLQAPPSLAPPSDLQAAPRLARF